MASNKTSTMITEADSIVLERYRKQLNKITTNDSIEKFYAMARQISPIIQSGLYEQTTSSNPYNVTDTLFDVAPEFIEKVMLNIETDVSVEAAVRIGESETFSDEDVFPLSIANEVKEYFDYPKYDMGHAFATKIIVKQTPCDTFHEAFFFFTNRAEGNVTEKSKLFFKLLHPELASAINRSRVPLIPYEEVLPQIFREKHTGYLCLRKNGSVYEINRRAYQLIKKYFPYLSNRPANILMREFVNNVLTGWAKQFPRSVFAFHADGKHYLELNKHNLKSSMHNLPEDIILIILEEYLFENQQNAASSAFFAEELTKRQTEIAALLAGTGLSYDEIAFLLGISCGTMRKHTENIYRRLDVHSRSELVMLVRSLGQIPGTA